MNIGQFVAAEIIIILVLNAVEKLMLSMETIYDVLTAVEKLGTVADIPLDPSGEIIEVEDDAFSVAMSNVSLSYPDDPLPTLNNVNLELEAGSKLLISGKDELGKTALLHLLSGMHDTYSGTLLYNEHNFFKWDKNQLREYIGDNLIKNGFFNGTIFENLTLGRAGIDEEDVKTMCKYFNVFDFIQKQNKDFDSQVLPEGRNIPKYILLKFKLIRSLLGNPKLILLDEDVDQLSMSDKEKLISFLQNHKATVVLSSNDETLKSQFKNKALVELGQVTGY